MAYQTQSTKMAENQGTTRKTASPKSDTKEMHSLMECMSSCASCAKQCVEEGNKATALLCWDCAKACDLAIQFKSCDSEFQKQALDLCAQICKKCADECSKQHSQHCQECAGTCKQCMEACKQSKDTRSMAYSH